MSTAIGEASYKRRETPSAEAAGVADRTMSTDFVGVWIRVVDGVPDGSASSSA